MALNHSTYSGMTLKALLENPDLQRAPAALNGFTGPKVKKGNDGSADIDFTSAFLGPQLWDKNNPDDFNLEYMDLDEFLSENGIPVVETPGLDQLMISPMPSPPSLPFSQDQQGLLRASPSQGSLPSPSPPMVMNPSSPAAVAAMSAAVSPVRVMSAANFVVKPKVEKTEELLSKQEGRAKSPDAASPGSSPPGSPLPVQVEFTLTEQDIALSSIPGQNAFNPAAHCFTEDELKPQPMLKKSQKVFVPIDMKDDKYWARRRKNNNAAKRSRDARRIKENQIAMRAAYLERENDTLKEELVKVRLENLRLKHRVSKYEAPTSHP